MATSFDIGTARVFLDKTHVDAETVKQITAMETHSSISHARIMPDCHKGNGCCIGFTCHLTDRIIPGIVGGDIGCGIAAYPLPTAFTSKTRSSERIYKTIERVVPMGSNVHTDPIIALEQYTPFYEEAVAEAVAFATAYKERFGVEIVPPTYCDAWFHNLARRIGSDFDYDLKCMGTLGGGNHFCEMDCTAEGQSYLVVHTGSRNLGMKIAQFHSALLTTVAEDEETTVDLRHVGLGGEQAAAYYFDMIWAQTWARMNRRAILSSVLCALGIEFSSESIMESIHNYIDFRDFIVRKGAIRAHAGETAIVALNMRDGILVCKGRGAEDWNWSGPHGCGRIVSRRAATASTTKRDLAAQMKKFEKEMASVDMATICPETLDEKPSVYRDMKIICDAIGPTLEIVAHARTVVNLKGH